MPRYHSLNCILYDYGKLLLSSYNTFIHGVSVVCVRWVTHFWIQFLLFYQTKTHSFRYTISKIRKKSCKFYTWKKKKRTNRNSSHVIQFLTYLIIECEELDGKRRMPTASSNDRCFNLWNKKSSRYYSRTPGGKSLGWNNGHFCTRF